MVFRIHKTVSALPTTLEADAIYMVRVGAGVDLYVTDSTGAVAYGLNGDDPDVEPVASQVFPELGGKVSGIAVPRPELVSGGNEWLLDIASRGFKFIRFEVYWDQIQVVQGGPLNLASTDAIVDNARALGLHVVLCPTGKPAWTDGRLDTAQKREDFAAYCADIAEHYKGRCDNFEICNEPNLGSCTPENYTLALQLVYPAIKASNPWATVCSAGIANASSTDDATRYYKPQDWLSRCYAVAGGMPCDMVGFHPYTWPKLYSDGDVADGLHRLSLHVRRLMVENGDEDKKIFVSEVGSPSGGDNAWGTHAPLTEAFQNQFFEEAFPLFEDADYVGGVAIYSYWDHSVGTSMEAYFGLYGVSGSEKLAMATVEAFNASYGAPSGADGKGWTGGSYDAATGVVNFASDDGLEFSTGDLRGVDGADGTSWTVTVVTSQAEYDAATPAANELVVRV